VDRQTVRTLNAEEHMERDAPWMRCDVINSKDVPYDA